MQTSNDGSRVDLYLVGAIGDWWEGTDVDSVMWRLNQSRDAQNIEVWLSSVGGYFTDGLPIFNLLKHHPAFVTTNVIGYSLSMASHIMLASDKVRIAQNGIVMIHNAQGFAYGDYRDFAHESDVLKVHNNSLIPEYMRRMKLGADEIQALLDKETWYDANQALAVGLVDEIIDPVDLDQVDKQQTAAAWSFAVRNFKHPPAGFTARLQNATKNQSLLARLVNGVVGMPPAPIIPDDPINDIEDDTMTAPTKEEIAAQVVAEMEKCDNSALAQAADLTAKVAKLETEKAALVAKLETLTQERDALKAQVTELQQPAPGTVVPENSGPNTGFVFEG